MRLLSPCLMLAPVALLFAAGCERTTGFCQTTADCTDALQCSPVTNTCQPAAAPDMAVPTPVPNPGAPVLAPSGSVPGDTFGYSLAATGTYAVFGSHLAMGTRGIAYVCDLKSTGCTNLAPLPPPDLPAVGDYYGVAVAASGNTIAVGAYNKDAGKGAVYVYVNSGAAWALLGKVTPPTAEAVAGDLFGIAVSLSGDHLVVGAHNKGGGAGAAYSFLRTTPSGAFAYNARLPSPGDGPLVAADYFGLQVATAAGVIAVGAPGRQSGKGLVYVYRNDFFNKPVLVPELTITGAAGEQLGGSALAMSPNTLAVGSPLYTPNPQNIAPGAVYLLDVALGGKPLMLPIAAPRPRQRVGFAVALAAAAGAVPETLITGAPGREQALLYRHSGTTWLPSAALDVPNEFNRSGFGTAVATTGTQHVVGIRGLPQDVGAAFVFTDK